VYKEWQKRPADVPKEKRKKIDRNIGFANKV